MVRIRDRPKLTNTDPEFFDFKKERNEVNSSRIKLILLKFHNFNFFQILETLGEPHVTSFNHFLTTGMEQMIKSIEPYEFALLNGDKLKVSIESCSITRPEIPTQIKVKERKFFPAEARQRAVTYAGNCNMTLAWSRNGVKNASIDFDLGPVSLNAKILKL